MIVVRHATAADLDWLIEQLVAFDRFYGAKHSLVPPDWYARDLISRLVDQGPFYVAVRELERVGFIAGAVHGHLYNPNVRVLTTLFWWVVPEARGSSAGARLFHELRRYARTHSIDQFILTLQEAWDRKCATGIKPETLLQGGFRPQETSYVLEL